VLDEPTSQLDPHAAEEVLQALVRLNRAMDLTVVLAEHRLERVLPFAGQVIYLDMLQPGALSGPPRDVLRQVDINPPLVTLGKALGWEPLPLTIEEARPFAGNLQETKLRSLAPQPPDNLPPPLSRSESFIRAEALEVSYGQVRALRGASLELHKGEIAVLMGPNGAGKTTLLRSMVGLARPQRGRILVEGQDIAGQEVADICRRVGYLPQDPNALLFADTVMEELLATLQYRQKFDDKDSKRLAQEQCMRLLERLGLADKAGAYPRDLSAGERQRVALGAILVTQPGALLLDEPTRGLDYAAKQALVEMLHAWRDEGMAVLLVTHDVELAAVAAERLILMQEGGVTAEGRPEQVLGRTDSSYFAPQVARLFPGAGWLTAAQAISALGQPGKAAASPSG
jgi:ABC-type multidrug transport system ATPase subunit